MAAFEEHCRDCQRLLGDRCEETNRWMDALFAKFGPLHRFARHHWRGVIEAGKLFGSLGARAAALHILKDCGAVPTDRDWKEQKVDSLGMRVEGFPRFNGYFDPRDYDRKARELLQDPRLI